MFSKLAHHSLILLCLLPLAKADVVIPKGAAGWNYLHVTDGIDPATADADFTTTWFHPTTGGYVLVGGPINRAGSGSPATIYALIPR